MFNLSLLIFEEKIISCSDFFYPDHVIRAEYLVMLDVINFTYAFEIFWHYLLEFLFLLDQKR